ncbi:hypothetical protein AB1N83_002542 [Pleurotus pulmonarius]
MNDDQPNQEINEGQRGRPIISTYPISRGRSTSGWRKSDVNNKRRSRSLVLFRSPRLGVVITLSTADTEPTVPSENDAVTHFPPSTSITFPEYSHLETATVAARHLVTQAPLPPDELFSEEPCATQRTASEHREQALQDTPAPTNQAACPPSRGTPALKKPKTNRLRILKKVLVALWKRKLNLPPREPERPPSPPVHPPSPMTVHRTTESEQDVDRNSCYLTAPSSPVPWSRSQIAEDDDNVSFFTAMSREPEDLFEPLSEIDSSNLVPLKSTSLPSLRMSLYSARSVSYYSLHDVDDRELARSEAYVPNILLSIPTPLPSHDLSSADSPEGHLRRRLMVNMRGNDVEEETGGTSPSTSGSDSMPPSPQSVSRVDSAKMAHSPVVTIDRDISIDHLPDVNGDIGSYIPKMKSHQSLLFQTKTDEDTTNEEISNVDKPPEDVKLAPLPAGGALDCIHWEAGFRRESTYYDTQGGHLGLTKEDTEQDVAVVAVACSSPSVPIHPELVPLPCDEEDLDLDLVMAGQTCSITQDQVIVSAESRQTSVSPALNVESEPEQHPLPGGSSDSPYISRVTQDASIDVFRERALEVMHPQSTNILPASRKHLDRMQAKHTTDPVVSESGLEADARGLGSEPQPSDKHPLGGATPGAGAQGRTRSLVENINQVGTQSTTSATDVQGLTIVEAEILRLLRMATRLVPTKKANLRNDTFDEGDLDRLFQSPGLVFNYNNIHNVTHASGDNFNGPMSQSAVGGHGARNNISNQK